MLLTWQTVRRRGLRGGSRPESLRHPLQLEPEREEQHPEDDRVGAQQPDERQRSGARQDRDQDAHYDREHAAEPQQPLVGDLPPQADRRRDLEDPREDRPGSDQVDQREGRQPGQEERHYTYAD